MDYTKSFGGPILCECCRTEGTIPVGIPDESGHIWTRYVCPRCEHCTTNEDGDFQHEPTESA